jgi:hypothetical protein
MLPDDDLCSSLLSRKRLGVWMESFGEVCELHDAT